MNLINKSNLAFFNGSIRKKSERDYNTNKAVAVTFMPFDITELPDDQDTKWDYLVEKSVEYLVERKKLPSFAKAQDYESAGFLNYNSYSELVKFANLLDEDDEDAYEIKLFDNAFDKIILPAGYKERIIEVVSQLKDSKKIFEEWGLEEKIKKGRGVNLLFSGDSGTGKTYCGQIIADYLGVEAEIVSVADIEDKYVGQSERNISSIFKSLKGGNKVLIIDEADSFLLSRGELKHSHENKLTNQFLIELERHNGICVMTTNRPVKLDKALARRIDINLHFPQPNTEARKSIWKYVIPSKMPQEKIDFDAIAEIQINGGIIKNAILSCARKMVTHGYKKLTTELILKTAKEELLELENANLQKDFS